MNLINDVWIPVRRKNGEKIKIAPWQITEDMGTDREIIELAAVRPDFNGALIQFLIGLLQTTCAPKGNSDWCKWLNNPPSADELKSKFAPIVFAFNLDGDGPRFMQDLTIEKENKKSEEGIENILIDAPGESTLKQNKDLFIKRDRIKQLCLSCGVQALLTLQVNAPEGGRGHWAGLRGGGPVSTIVLDNNLWRTLWCNVLDVNELAAFGTVEKNDDVDKFPWLEKTRVSSAKTRKGENGKKEKSYSNIFTSQDVNPIHIYWAVSRRIRFYIDKKECICDLCHQPGQQITKYYTKPYGAKYIGFIHSLSPSYKKETNLFSVHQHEVLGYKHWLGYIHNTDEGSEPARVITAAFNRRLNNFRLWAFGYDMDNMKACCWYEGVMPVIFIENEMQWEHYNSEIAMLIRAADTVSDLLSYAVSDAMKEKKKKDRDYTRKIKAVVSQRFWQETEPEFYHQIASLRDEVIQDNDGLSVRRAWYEHLVGKALDIFNDMSQAEMIEDVNAERVARAHNELRKNLSGKKLKIDILGLPKEEKEAHGNKNSDIPG